MLARCSTTAALRDWSVREAGRVGKAPGGAPRRGARGGDGRPIRGRKREHLGGDVGRPGGIRTRAEALCQLVARHAEMLQVAARRFGPEIERQGPGIHRSGEMITVIGLRDYMRRTGEQVCRIPAVWNGKPPLGATAFSRISTTRST